MWFAAGLIVGAIVSAIGILFLAFVDDRPNHP